MNSFIFSIFFLLRTNNNLFCDDKFCVKYKTKKYNDFIEIIIEKRNISNSDTLISFSNYSKSYSLQFVNGNSIVDSTSIDSIFDISAILFKRFSRIGVSVNATVPKKSYELFYPGTKKSYKVRISKSLITKYKKFVYVESYAVIKNNSLVDHFIPNCGFFVNPKYVNKQFSINLSELYHH